MNINKFFNLLLIEVYYFYYSLIVFSNNNNNDDDNYEYSFYRLKVSTVTLIRFTFTCIWILPFKINFRNRYDLLDYVRPTC